MLSLIQLFVLLLTIFPTECGVSQHNPFYCYSDDPTRQWSNLGGIHSPYEAIRGENIYANVSTCNPTKFWMLGRHASRWPFDTELPDLFRVVNAVHDQLLKNYDQGRTSLCASDFELLRNWQFNPNITMDVAGDISPSGWIEMEAMAKRFQTAFPTILPATYSPNDYFFRHSPAERTRHSLDGFADGLFGGHEQIQFEDVPELDVYLRPYDYCPLFDDLAVFDEQAAFILGPEYQQMVVEVSAKLGFHHSNVLRGSEVALLALQCKYEQTWNLNYKDPSPFCAAFSTANAQVIAYSMDLRHYRRMGYGMPNYRRLYENLSCHLLQDMLRFFQSNDVNDHKARIFNGHVGIFMFLMHFEVFNEDELLTRHNFAQQTERVWKSAHLFPMACNLVVIRYDCPDADNDLLFLYNEKPLQIPGCDSNGVCKQSLILQRFDRYLNANCTEIFCTNS